MGSSELWFLNSTPLAKFLRTRIKEPTHSEKRAKRADPNKKTRESFGVVEVVDDDTMTIERKLFCISIRTNDWQKRRPRNTMTLAYVTKSN